MNGLQERKEELVIEFPHASTETIDKAALYDMASNVASRIEALYNYLMLIEWQEIEYLESLRSAAPPEVEMLVVSIGHAVGDCSELIKKQYALLKAFRNY